MSRTAPYHAATAVYSEGDFVFLQLRASKGYTTELSFPATPGGMASLLRVLREREMAGAASPQRIAAPTMPIQHVIDGWSRLPEDRIYKSREREAAALIAKARKDADFERKQRNATERADRERFRTKPREQQLAELSAMFDQDL